MEREDGDCWVGHWIEGMGFVNVYFPKSTVRPCTEEEKRRFLRCTMIMPNGERVRFPFKEEDFA